MLFLENALQQNNLVSVKSLNIKGICLDIYKTTTVQFKQMCQSQLSQYYFRLSIVYEFLMVTFLAWKYKSMFTGYCMEKWSLEILLNFSLLDFMKEKHTVQYMGFEWLEDE